MLNREQPINRFFLLAILLLAFTSFLHDLTYQDIWWDEARNLDVALRPIGQIATAPELDIHPPLYFWLLHGWLRLVQAHEDLPPEMVAFAARLLSSFAGLCSVALLYPLGRRLHGANVGLIATIIAAFSPFWLAESQETRMYTLSFALLTAAAWYLLRIVSQRTHNCPFTIHQSLFTIYHLPYFLFVLLSTASLYTHYNAIFILVAWYVWWGVSVLFADDRSQSLWQRLQPPLYCGLATIALLLPVFPIALRQIPTYANPNLVVPTLGDYLWQNWHGYLGGYALDDVVLWGFSNQWLWLILCIAISGLALPVIFSATSPTRQPHHTRRTTAARLVSRISCLVSRVSCPVSSASFLPVWLLGGLALYYIAVLDRGAFNVRYSSFVTPPLYLLLGLALANWARIWRPLMLLGLGVLFAGVIPALRADLYDPRFAREDVGDLADWLRQEAGPHDLILVDQKYPFGFYYERYAVDAAAMPTGPEAAPARYLFVDVNTVDRTLTAWAADAERVFWVQWFESDTDPRHAVRFLLDIYGERAGERRFQGYDVDWWQLTPPTLFQLPSTWEARSIRFADAVETTELAFPATAHVDEKLPVAIRWQRIPGGTIEEPLKARVALYDRQDNRLAQADERLLNDRHRLPSDWAGDEQPLNLYLLAMPEEVAAGTYELRLLVYNADTLEPLPFLDAVGNPKGIEEILGEVEIGQ